MSSGGLAGGERPRPLEVLQPRGSPRASQTSPQESSSSPRLPQHPTTDHSPFGYESDDSSLSSNASGSNKSSDKDDYHGCIKQPGKASRVETQSRSSEHSSSGGSSGYHQWGGGGHTAREWRNRRDPRQRRVAPIAPDRFLNAAYPFQVKYTPHELLNGSQWDGLSQDIWDKFIKSQQTEETFRKKMNLWRYLYITIKTIFPRYGLYVVGSTMSGFGLETSDMDLCLFVRPPEHGEHAEPRAHALLHLSFILHYIRSIDNRAELIHAKVPILKFRDARHELQVDLNCNNVVGIRNTNLLNCYSQLDWRVRPLMAAAKLWARAHDINDARRRTLSSYSLTLMLIHFLQCGVSPGVVPCVAVAGSWDGSARAPPHYRSPNRLSLGELFLRFLHYYAHFPYSRLAVSVRCGRALPIAECRSARADKNDPHQWKLLCVEEPFDLTNTARCVYDPETFDKIVATFRDSYSRLSVGLRLSDAWPSDR